jgi:hypothetical protein
MTTIESFDRVIEFVAQNTDIPVSTAEDGAQCLDFQREQYSIEDLGRMPISYINLAWKPITTMRPLSFQLPCTVGVY